MSEHLQTTESPIVETSPIVEVHAEKSLNKKAPEKTKKTTRTSSKAKNAKSQHDAHHVGFLALPVSTSQLIKKHNVGHPGLVLNKYAVLLRMQEKRLQYEWGNDQQKRLLQRVQQLLTNSEELKSAWEERFAARQNLMKQLQANQLSLHLQSPLVMSLHHPFAQLSVELHPIAGFPYLSAAHIKGALRQYVQEQWLPQQSDHTNAQKQIHLVFGEPGREQHNGAICFHDAWPENWPSVLVELNSNHHQAYYARQQAPGDWQIPEANYMLCLKPGVRFNFAISRRSPSVTQSTVEQCMGWLQSLLTQNGLGAYRQLGMGRFRSGQATVQTDWQTTLKLYSPAFLSGVSQRQDDCRLRPGHLRGLLRWWWRTLHSGYLPPRELLNLETLIWGSAKRKGAVSIGLDAPNSAQARRYHPEELLKILPAPEGERRSAGLSYLSYGLLSENAKRYFMGSDAEWNVTVNTRDTTWRRKDDSIKLSAEVILQQVQAALWLLCHYGGIGQRKRKGFGSLQELTLDLNEDKCLEWASALREQCKLNNQFDEILAESPSLFQRIELSDVTTPWRNPWFTLHQIGESLQSYMQAHKHEAQKLALGLPRNLEAPISGDSSLPSIVSQRHAAPYFIHLSRNEAGHLMVRTVAFPAAKLPNSESSQQALSALMRHLRSDLQARVTQWAEEPNLEAAAAPLNERRKAKTSIQPKTIGRPEREKPVRIFKARTEKSSQEQPLRPEKAPYKRPEMDKGKSHKREKEWPPRERGERPLGKKHEQERRPVNKTGIPQAGDWIEATLLEERTKKGGWRAQHTLSKLSGPLLNSGQVSSEAEAGTNVSLIVHASNKFEMSFRWPTESEREQRNQTTAGRSKK